MMDCKHALQEAKGDIEKASRLLQAQNPYLFAAPLNSDVRRHSRWI